jgi:hypothetical protein
MSPRPYRGPERRTLPDYARIDVTDVTPRTAPPYVLMSFIQRNSSYVLAADDDPGKLLVGRYGVQYHEDGKASQDGIYLRRWDVPPVRGSRGRWSLSDHVPSRTKG